MSKLSNFKQKLKIMGYSDDMISLCVTLLVASGHKYVGKYEDEVGLGFDLITKGEIRLDYSQKPTKIFFSGKSEGFGPAGTDYDITAKIEEPIDPANKGYPNSKQGKIIIASTTKDGGIVYTSGLPGSLMLVDPEIVVYSGQQVKEYLSNPVSGPSVFDIVSDDYHVPVYIGGFEGLVSYGLPFKGQHMVDTVIRKVDRMAASKGKARGKCHYFDINGTR